jgi:hypothetical protein
MFGGAVVRFVLSADGVSAWNMLGTLPATATRPIAIASHSIGSAVRPRARSRKAGRRGAADGAALTTRRA